MKLIPSFWITLVSNISPKMHLYIYIQKVNIHAFSVESLNLQQDAFDYFICDKFRSL
jgi:hypothetical protein